MAFVHLRQQNMEKAKTWLARIKENQLWPRQRGYYYFLMGSMTMEQNMNDAEKFIKRALQLGLKDHDKAVANLNLAVVASTEENFLKRSDSSKKVSALTQRELSLATSKWSKMPSTVAELALEADDQVRQHSQRRKNNKVIHAL